MANFFKTFLLLGVLSTLVIGAGALLGGRTGLYLALGISLVMNIGAYFFSDKLALKSSGARPVTREQEPELYAIVEELTRKVNIPMPRLYRIPAMQANAFATGRNPKHAAVAVTDGLMQTLSRDEIEAVLAHEIAHVKNRDILTASIAAVLASALGFVVNLAAFGFGGGDDEEGGSPFGILGLLVAFIAAPLLATILQLAVSRQREYAADASAKEYLGTGRPLAEALHAIHDTTRMAPMHTNPAYSSLYISSPLGGLGGTLTKLFSTHPPVEDRIRRLTDR